MEDSVVTIIWIVSFVVVTVAVSGLTKRIGWSAPVSLVLVGAVASFVPGVPHLEIEPDLILYGLLPPLLFAAAIRTSFVDVRARRDGILLLSVGLVAFTVVTVGLTAWLVVPAISLAAAFAFGAVVAPTDAVAITAIAGRLGLPRRVVTAQGPGVVLPHELAYAEVGKLDPAGRADVLSHIEAGRVVRL